MQDGFYIAELDGRLLDVCVIGGSPEFIRAQDGRPFPASYFDRVGIAGRFGKLREAAAFTPDAT